jgi:hypothetical protein
MNIRVVSHDEIFLEQINIEKEIKLGKLRAAN